VIKVLPKYHILLGFIFSLALFFIFPSIKLIGAGIIFLSSFLIDVDHYIYYVLKKKDTNFKKSVNYFLIKRKKLIKIKIEERNKLYSGFCFLHGIESFIILFLAGIFISRYFLFVLFGFAFHLFLDIFQEIHENLRIDKISVIYDWLKFKKLKFLK
jgi:hypothetical protein